MRRVIISIVLLCTLSNSGCGLILAGAAGYGIGRAQRADQRERELDRREHEIMLREQRR